MDNVIQFKLKQRRSTEYLHLLAEAGSDLTLMVAKLEGHAVNLAALGEWKSWSDGCAADHVAFIEDAALLKTADEHVVALVQIYLQLREAADTLGKAAAAGLAVATPT